MAKEPLSLEQRQALLEAWEREWSAGGDVTFAVIVDGEIAGSCGLHRRRGPDTLEIGYWIHAAFLRRGLATSVASLLTDAAFSIAGIDQVEIHHDKANAASAGVPLRLGYQPVGERPKARDAPAEVGIDCTWRISRTDWQRAVGDR